MDEVMQAQLQELSAFARAYMEQRRDRVFAFAHEAYLKEGRGVVVLEVARKSVAGRTMWNVPDGPDDLGFATVEDNESHLSQARGLVSEYDPENQVVFMVALSDEALRAVAIFDRNAQVVGERGTEMSDDKGLRIVKFEGAVELSKETSIHSLAVQVQQDIESDWNNVAGFAWKQYKDLGRGRGMVFVNYDLAKQQGQAFLPLRYVTLDEAIDDDVSDRRNDVVDKINTYDPQSEFVSVVLHQGLYLITVHRSSPSRLAPPEAAKVPPAAVN